MPEAQADRIVELLKELHVINFFSLTFTGSPGPVEGRRAWCQEQLKGEISEKYRQALENKIKRSVLALDSCLARNR